MPSNWSEETIECLLQPGLLIPRCTHKGCALLSLQADFGFNSDGTLMLLIKCDVVILLFVFAFLAEVVQSGYSGKNNRFKREQLKI